MATRDQPSPALYVEPVPVGEEFASGAALIEMIGTMTFLVFYVDQIQPPELESRRERRISRRMILPTDEAARLARMLASALADRGKSMDEASAVANGIAA